MLNELFAYVCGQGRPFVLDGEALPVCQRCLGLYAGAALTGLWILASGLWRRGLPERSAAYAHIVMLLAAMAGGVHWLDAGPTWRLVCGLWTGHVAMLWLVGGAGHFLRLAGRKVLVLRRPLFGFRAAGLLTRRAGARRGTAGRSGSVKMVGAEHPPYMNLRFRAAGLLTRRADGTHALGQRGGSGDPPRETMTDPPRQVLSAPPRPVLDNPPPQAFDDPPWPRGLRAQTLAAGPVLAMLAVAFTQFVSSGWQVAAGLIVIGAAGLAVALVRAAVGVGAWAFRTFRRPRRSVAPSRP